MKLSTIKKRYPNAFHKFYTSKFCENYYLRIANVPIMETDARNHWKEITDFMDKQGIKIYAYPNGKSWIYVIIGVFRIERGLKNRQQAETKAIEKAFEILEGRSKRANT